jgi:pantetheine-phosphate adenylyltransferase
MRVCFSGAFNVLHKGHKALIDQAFQAAGKNGTVFIGVTGGDLLQNKRFVIPFDERVEALKKYLAAKGYGKRTVIRAIFDKHGPAVDGEYDTIIVSPETYDNAREINILRTKNGKKPLKIIKTPHVLAEDGKPISSTRILNNEIDEHGNITK